MPIQPESIAEEVRALLGRRKLSQRSLAQMLGWQQSQVSRRLSGNTPITASELAELADVLNVTVESLYGRPSGFIAEAAAPVGASS